MKVKEGDRVLLLVKGKEYLVEVSDRSFGTNQGMFELKDAISKEYGSYIVSSTGVRGYLLRPTLYDLMMKIKRQTQIVYPKDAGYILLRLGIGPGMRVLECGCGSGSLTMAFAFAVGDTGKVYSYDERDEFITLAKENLARARLHHRVEFKCRRAQDGFDEKDVNAVFLDLPEPWVAIQSAWQSLAGGGVLGTLSPTYNQIERTVETLMQGGFEIIETVEILVREILARPGKTRPRERMVSHTAFLMFARKVNE